MIDRAFHAAGACDEHNKFRQYHLHLSESFLAKDPWSELYIEGAIGNVTVNMHRMVVKMCPEIARPDKPLGSTLEFVDITAKYWLQERTRKAQAVHGNGDGERCELQKLPAETKFATATAYPNNTFAMFATTAQMGRKRAN